MPSPFPDLPRGDCTFVPTVSAFSGPLVPKPLWTGASSYADPAYPSGGGPDDVPAAKPPIGQATPATLSPPTQTSMGGSGGGSLSLVQAVANGSAGLVSVKTIQLKEDITVIPNFEQVGAASSVVYLQP